ncbi:MAG: FAD-dependent oxidoreductase [Myxococcales bacterium]|nr:FAD-dependent oxidoreductase [Myxococcales bacterium]
MKRIAILGAGTAGTMMANRLNRTLGPRGWTITVIDRDNQHIYQPGLLFVPFGDYTADEIVRPRKYFVDPQVELRIADIEKVEPEAKRVVLAGGDVVPYEILIVATGSRILPESVDGLTGHGWKDTAFDFYSLDGASALFEKLDRFEGGKVLVHTAEMPIKCPVAPLEFAYLADAFFTKKGIRDKVEMQYVTPLDGAFTKPRAAAAFGGMMADRKIEVVPDFLVEKTDGERQVMSAYDGRDLEYDLLVTVPPHRGSQVITDSGLGNDGGWLPVNKFTLQSTAFPEIFGLGDATDVPASKAGSVAHFQSEVLADNIVRFIEGLDLDPGFDGHANCFIETGYGKAMLIDFNYDTEPLPGRFPLPGVGPFTLLEESRVNHWGKLGFRWVYWNMLLPGDDLPLDHRMLMAGKRA